tara:strand:- start:1665 stop:2963 length:1299 start_codon:yes stop_codon:yes gene_type:complete
MYVNNYEEDRHGAEDGEKKDEKMDMKREKDRARRKIMSKVKHIKVRPSDLEAFDDDKPEGEDDANKKDEEREISAQTGPPGNLGFLTSLAMGARGPGAAGGQMVAMSEPMEVAFRLLKQEAQGFVPDKNPEPKKDKGEKAKEKKAKKERSKKFRPSTGQFKMPPGGVNPASATSRRAKARSRGIKSDKKTGLGRAHLAVEMSHRGVQTKQPMSKDPKKYRQYMGQQEGRKRLGGVRTVTSTPSRFGARSYRAGPTGGGTLQGVQRPRRPALKPHRIPPIMPPAVPPRPSMPTPPPIPSAPPMPMAGVAQQQMAGPPMMRPGRVPTSSVQGIMTGPQGSGSDLQKRSLTYYDIAELRQLVNEARRAIKQKESKKKGMGTKDTGGAGSNLPKHPENGPKQTTRPEGATEDANNEPRTFGMDPIGHYTSRGGRTP